MTTLQLIGQMVNYHYAFHHRIWESIMTLTDEQFTQEIPYSQGSIRNHMVHLAQVDTRWLRGLKSDPNARAYRLNAEEYPTRESVRALCDQAERDVKEFVATLTDTDIDRQPQGLPFTIGQVLMQVVNHGTDHRAQILRALHDFGAPTFDQDVVYYFMGK